MLDRHDAKTIGGNVQSHTALVHVRQLVSPQLSAVRYDMLVNAKADTGSCVCYKSVKRLGRFIRQASSEPGG